MKKILLTGLGFGFLVSLLFLMTACSSNQAELDKLKADNQKLTAANQQLKEIAGPPPASLAQYFPPKSPAPVFLLQMFALAGPMESIGGDLQKQDLASAKAHFAAFKAQYTKASQMVPEWSSRFPAGPVDALGAAINAGDPSKIGPAMGGVGKVCGDCHLIYQIKVQQQYHWPNFDNIKVTDPISKQELKWVDYMTAMVGSFGGGQAGSSQSFQAFQSQYQTLAKDGCKQCHTDPVTKQEIPRKYFVDADSMALIDQLGKAISANPPDTAAIGKLSGAIGNDICLKCHLVHLQAQNAKDIWEQFKDILK